MNKKFLTSAFFICNVFFCSAQTLQDAKKLTENEQYEAASFIYQSLIAKSPSDASLYYYYGDNLLLSDNPDSAKIIFDKATATDASNPFVKIGNAKLLLDNVNLREAKNASEKDPSNSEMKHRYEDAQNNITSANKLIDEAVANAKDINILIEAAEALIHYKNKDTDKAKTLLDKAAAMDQKNTEVLLLYGDLYTELNNGTLAADYYNKALDQNKSSARAIVSKGRLYKRSTNFDGAAREFENAISIDPSYAPAHRELAETYFKQSKLTQAKDEYKKYLDLSKNNCGARIRYATFLYFSKAYSEAVNELNQVKQRCDPNNITMLRVLTYCYYELKDTTNGTQTAKKLFELLTPEKRTATDYEYYGKMLILLNQDSLGIEQLHQALTLEPNRCDLFTDLANAWIKLKVYKNAIELLNQKIAACKPVVMDYYTLSRAYYFDMQFAPADSAISKAIDLSPKWSGAWLQRAKINAQIDSTSEAGLAKPYYEKYIEFALADSANAAKYQNGMIEAYTYMAYYYILKKDEATSKSYLYKKLDLPLEPEDRKNVQKAIDQLEGRGPKPQKK